MHQIAKGSSRRGRRRHFRRRGLSAVDLFDIESKGRVIEPGGALGRVVAGEALPGERVTRDANGNITSFEKTFQNGGSQKARGIDFGLQYQIETRVGTFTSLTQASFLDSFQFAQLPGEPELELRSGASFGSLFTGSNNEGHLKWKGNSRLDWAWHGLDAGMTVHYLDGFHEIDRRGLEHYVKQTWFFDVQASYNFRFVGSVETKPEAGYSEDARESTHASGSTPSETAAAQTANYGLPVWKRMLNGTTVTLGCNNVFGHDPPDANATTNYPGFAYDSTGRFVYMSVKKKF